ncbi:NADH peroxidase [mine drainage metagenome]|uniref:NADH peroxidase n=1 Tax=mine drainage metagenome TaxID=410659 RepID=A0A1J5RX00_9ZZZZ
MTRLLIMGGSDAGISEALRVHKLDPQAEISVLSADKYPNDSICGLPFYLSGETPDHRQLAHRTAFDGIDILTNHRAVVIHPVGKRVDVVRGANGRAETMRYDHLIIAIGATPVRPQGLPGLDLPGVYLLHTMADSFAVHHHLTMGEARSALIIGADYIGVEMADALRHSKATFSYARWTRFAYLKNSLGFLPKKENYLCDWRADGLALNCSYLPQAEPRNRKDWKQALACIVAVPPRRTWLTRVGHTWLLSGHAGLLEHIKLAEDRDVADRAALFQNKAASA